MRLVPGKFVRALAGSALAVGLAGAVAVSAPAANATEAGTQSLAACNALAGGNGTPAGAVAWYQRNNGRTSCEHYCELAAERAYGTSGVWASAIAHWNGATQHRNRNAPLGAFVYWNISQYGHVGVSDGKGGAWATGVGGRIGHISSLNGFSNYLGWTPAARPRQ